MKIDFGRCHIFCPSSVGDKFFEAQTGLPLLPQMRLFPVAFFEFWGK
jgi:hypothetical protein